MKFERLPEHVREKAVSDVFCIGCQKSFRLENFQEAEFRGNLILTGACPNCGGEVAKPVSTAELDVH